MKFSIFVTYFTFNSRISYSSREKIKCQFVLKLAVSRYRQTSKWRVERVCRRNLWAITTIQNLSRKVEIDNKFLSLMASTQSYTPFQSNLQIKSIFNFVKDDTAFSKLLRRNFWRWRSPESLRSQREANNQFIKNFYRIKKYVSNKNFVVIFDLLIKVVICSAIWFSISATSYRRPVDLHRTNTSRFTTFLKRKHILEGWNLRNVSGEKADANSRIFHRFFFLQKWSVTSLSVAL